MLVRTYSAFSAPTPSEKLSSKSDYALVGKVAWVVTDTNAERLYVTPEETARRKKWCHC